MTDPQLVNELQKSVMVLVASLVALTGLFVLAMYLSGPRGRN